MRTPRPGLGLLLVLCLLSGLLLASPGPARAERLGPGHPPQPDFSGYTTAADHELGVARLSNGVIGVCLDTGTKRWPHSSGRSVAVTDPVVGYLLSVHLQRARHDGVLAAALWWAVGKERGLNSGPRAMAARMAELRREDRRLHDRVVRRAHALLAEARRYAAPRGGYVAARPVLTTTGATGTVAGLGLRAASGRTTPGVVVRVTLRGARFRDGRSTVTRTSSTTPLALVWKRIGAQPVDVVVRYTRVPHHRYRLYRAGVGYQRVAASAGLRSLSASAHARALATPSVTTLVNLQRAEVGTTLVDAVTVDGAGRIAVVGEWQLLGPVAPGASGCRDRSWAGVPVAGRGSFHADGDGTYAVGATRIASTGCYTYRERLRGSTRTAAVPWTVAGVVEETSHVTSRPAFRTTVNRQRAVAGATLVDSVIVSGTPQGPGATALAGEWQLLGPVAPDRQDRCRAARWTGAPIAAAGSFSVTRDGAVQVGRTRVQRGGCYTYRERIAPTAHSAGVPWSRAGLVEETALVVPRQPDVPRHPQVATGGSHGVPPAGRVMARAPRVSVTAAGIAAALRGVDFRGSTLPAPYDRGTAGVWTRGADLSALVGTTVVTGHVSDDHDRPGVFHALRRVRPGQQVRTTASDGKVLRWRVVSVRSYDRRRLPRSLFHQGVARRLLLITCTDRVTFPGGFHYRKNLVVEAEPW